MTSSTRQPRGSGSRRRAGRPAPGGAAYPAPRPSRQPMPRQSYRPASAKHPAKPQRRARKPHTIDMPTMCATLLLLLVGLIALFSASYSNALYTQGSATYFIARQLKWAAGGLIAMFLLSKWDYHDYKYLTIPAIAISVFLLILVLIPGVGTTTKGATRWLFGFQPSELAKDAVIICFAAWASTKYRDVRHWKKLLYPYGALLAVYIFLLAKEPHNSAIIITCGIGLIMLIAAGLRIWFLIPAGILAVLGAFASYLTFEHVRNRVNIWLDPFSDMRKTGFQAAMGQIAIGSGGLFGRGLGNGMQKQLYLPEPHNDFIFATWCEEMGLIGALAVIAVFAYLIWRGLRIARSSPDRMGMLLATGITAKLAIQTIMNLFVVTGLMPVTGASLPFFSYGGTALMLQLAEMGILLNVSRYMRIEARTE